MSKEEYQPPTGAPPSWSQGNNTGYSPQAQPVYNQQTQDRGYGGYPQQGYPPPPPQGYYQQPGYGAPPPQGYYQAQPQQPMYVQQQSSSNNEGCLMACLAALCICCTLDMLF
ncbi:uncharacterized protein J8A68_001675 [[Candida] subhashii]|uniref:Cysteine-rich transmembrane domain-containing protein n=1 Tax=[Candida] subhashii TaxID=561895 RepID=A0A8J5QQV6_9ASCO|nr:uncharacterized protein J8A68_001675 [[Candida] subhashii]KAG7664793.1 hypothetical protein J8A68_001675 [[Candida] subhashii]